jgi:hypothetical protein
MAAILDYADLIVGHQLSSDLAVLAAAAQPPDAGVATAQAAWRQRSHPDPWAPACS